MIPNLLSSRAKWTIEYPVDPGGVVAKATGISIDEAHVFLLEPAEHGLTFWASYFMRRGTPYATIRLVDGRWGIWKHKFTHGQFCCGADA